jgi:hypothetical protein
LNACLHGPSLIHNHRLHAPSVAQRGYASSNSRLSDLDRETSKGIMMSRRPYQPELCYGYEYSRFPGLVARQMRTWTATGHAAAAAEGGVMSKKVAIDESAVRR